MDKQELIKEISMDMLHAMPACKKETLHKALERNCFLTSTYTLEQGEMTVYKEGWYLRLEGTRCSFCIYADDNDGEFVFRRKPEEGKLHKLYSCDFRCDSSDYKFLINPLTSL